MNNIVQYILVGIIVAFAIYKVVKHLTTPAAATPVPLATLATPAPTAKIAPPKNAINRLEIGVLRSV